MLRICFDCCAKVIRSNGTTSGGALREVSEVRGAFTDGAAVPRRVPRRGCPRSVNTFATPGEEDFAFTTGFFVFAFITGFFAFFPKYRVIVVFVFFASCWEQPDWYVRFCSHVSLLVGHPNSFSFYHVSSSYPPPHSAQ